MAHAPARSNPWRGAWAVSCALVVGGLAAGCAGGTTAPSTRLRMADFQAMTAALAADLSGSHLLVDRSPTSPVMTIAMDRVENLTSDLITEGEGWYLMDRVRDSQDLLSLSEERNVRFVIPAARTGANRAIEPDAFELRAPTHAMRATIRSLTRQALVDRTEFYDIEYRVMDLDTGITEWTGTYPIKRAAVGREWD